MDKINGMVSIIVPIYKVEKYLDRCVQSILKQTYRDFEVILVDDGSPDKCPEICDEWAKKDKRIKVIHKENGGLSDARNVGMQAALGKYIAFVDSDDWVSTVYLEYLIKAMADSECDIIECETFWTEEKIPFEETAIKSNRKVAVFQAEEALEQLIKEGYFHQHVWNKLYKRTIIQDIPFEKDKTNEDEFWTYRVFGNTKTIGKIEVPLYYYFQRATSIMGIEFSLKRLDALEAKMQRQRYIEENYPELKEIAQIDLFTSCIYQGQLSLLNLKGEQFFKAKEQINSIVEQIKPTIKLERNLSISEKIWILSAKFFFWKICWVKNLLKKGF